MRTTISLKNDVSMPVAAGLLLTVALSFFLCHRFVDQAAGNMARSVGERRGIVQAMALAETASHIESEGTDIEDRLVIAVERWSRLSGGGVRIVRLSGAGLLASTMPGDNDAPRPLEKDDERLIEPGRRLRDAFETNLSEGSARRKELLIEHAPGSRLLVAAPYFLDGTVHGYVQVDMPRPRPNRRGSGGPALLGAALSLGVFSILAVLLSRFGFFRPDDRGLSRGQLALAAGVLLMGLWIFAATQFPVLADHQWELEERLAKHYLVVRTASVDIARMFAYPLAPFTNNRWDTDEYRRPLNLSDGHGRVRLKALVAVQTSQFKRMRLFFDGMGLLALALLLFCGSGWAGRLVQVLFDQ
jgi:hypothetical protein